MDSRELNPNLAAESNDDAKCKAFMAELGMLEPFTRAHDPNLSVLTFNNHLTHWIIGMLWSGYPKPEHNGYRLVCLPKNQIPEAGAKDGATLSRGGGGLRGFAATAFQRKRASRQAA